MAQGRTSSGPGSGIDYRRMVEHLPDAIIVHEGCKIAWVNPAALKLFGASHADQLLERLFPDFVPPEDRDRIWERCREPGKPEMSMEQKVLRLDGTVVETEAMFIPFDLEGRPAVQTVLRDITTRKELEARFLHAQKLEAIGTLAGGIAHDFNNILGAIIAFTELAKMDGQGEALADDLEEVLRASQRAKDLVSQILTFSRRQAHEKTVLQLGLIVKEAMRLLRAALPANIQVSAQIDPGTPPVLADPGQVHQVLMNLCTNAAHAIGTQQGRLEVRVSAVQEAPSMEPKNAELRWGSFAKLTVTDNGSGMDAETAKRIFDPFFTTKPSDIGTGLGLAVVHGIVQEHHGAIRVKSELGRGSTFEVFWPAAEPAKAGPKNEGAKPLSGNGERILVVDDEATLARVTKKMLEKLGYVVEMETNPAEALARFKAHPEEFDLLITDLTMPNITGVELALEVRKIRPELPVLVCTGFSSYWEPEAIRKVGISDLIYKPLTAQVLASAIAAALRQSGPKS